MKDNLPTLIQPHRHRHTRIIGQTGTGKSTTLCNLILDDIERGHGVCFIDPHGQDTHTVLGHFPQWRRDDLIVFDPSDLDWPVPFNILKNIPRHLRPNVATAVLDILKSMWKIKPDFSPTRINMIVYHCVAALLDRPDGSLLGIPLMLSNHELLKAITYDSEDVMVKRYWQEVFLKKPKKEKDALVESTFSPLQTLFADPRIRNTLGQSKSAFSMSDVLEKNRVLLIRVPQGHLGIQKAATIGCLMLASLHSAALQRRGSAPFHIHIDEAHLFDCPTLIEMLSGIRKFGVSLTLSHQYVAQGSAAFQSALAGNAGTNIVFRVGSDDADQLDKLLPDNNTIDLPTLEPFETRIVTPDSTLNRRFFATTNKTRPVAGNPKNPKPLLKLSRISYASPREHVEKKLDDFIRRY